MTRAATAPAPVDAPARAAAPIRVLQFISRFDVGGTEGQALALAGGLDPARFALSLACLGRSGALLAPPGAARGAAPAEYRVRNLYGPRSFAARARFAADLRRRRVQVVHTHGFYPNVFAVAAARVAGVPAVVASIRDMGVYLTPRQLQVQRLACRLAHRVVVNAAAIERWLVAGGYAASRITVIPNGVDLARFGPRADGALRAELGLPVGCPLVAVVSRVNRSKGLDDFLRAAALVAARRPDARFAVIGPASDDAAYPAELAALAAHLGLAGRCVFTGLRMDVPAVLAQVTVSALPSLSEGLSNALLESMAAGAPVVATRVGGTAEAVEDGVSGLLVPPRDPARLAAGIEALLADRALAERCGRAAQRVIAARFSAGAAVGATERLYERLVGERAA